MKNKNILLASIKKYFRFDSLNAILRKEIIGGITTFLAMAYILAVNPAIVGDSLIIPGIEKPLKASIYNGGLFLATAISACVATFIMGLFAKIPVALAPGMGLNAFFAYTISYQVGFESALSITILSGVAYIILVLTPAREKLSKLIPSNLKLAIGVGIGFFVAYVGLQNSKIIVDDPSSPALVSRIGDFGNPLVIIALVLLIVGFVLHYSKIQGAIIITMLLGAIILIPTIAFNAIDNFDIDKINPAKIGYGDFSTFSNVIEGGWRGFTNKEMWKNPITYIGVLSFLYMDFFDTTGTLLTIDRSIDLSKTDPKWLSKANYVDALSTLGGAAIGATTVTSFVESTVGVASGAKTGFAAIITSICFGLTIAIWPIMQVFMPIDGFQPITGPILILVGTMMVSQIKHFDWKNVIDIPTLFMTVIMMMLSNSIAYGICFGTLSFVLLNGSLGIMQILFKNNEWMANTIEIPITDENGELVKAKHLFYIKRINSALLIICIISIIYIVLQTGITYHGWFK